MNPSLLRSISVKYQLLLLLVVLIGLNANTLSNEYALDDTVVLTENRIVQQGINGIPEILRTDYVRGFTKEENILSAGRFRPLTLISFALEYQFFGASPLISHLINLVLFALLIFLLFRILQIIFHRENSVLPFLACLFFILHPIHTEVIANVKSRDELLTFLFTLLSLLSTFAYLKSGNKRLQIASFLCFFCALLAKETAITYLAILPLILFYFSSLSFSKILRITTPFLLLAFIYAGIRYNAIGFHSYTVTDVTNSPYIYATYSDAFATKTFVVLKYILLLFFPVHLTTEYGFQQIPMIQIRSFSFIISAVCILALLSFAMLTFKKKSIVSFCILYFFITLSPGTNFIIDLGAPMAERMLFQPSLAFCILLSILILKFAVNYRYASIGLALIISILFSVKTIARNSEWKNNETLFLADILNSPNSARMNLYVCEQYILKANKEVNLKTKYAYLDTAINYGERSMQIHSKFAYTYLRLGLAHLYRSNYETAAKIWIRAAELEPKNPEVIYWTSYLSNVLNTEGNMWYEKDSVQRAIQYYELSLKLNANNIETLYNLGGMYFANGDSVLANEKWEKVRTLDPRHRFNKSEFIKENN
ncbi:MAG: hypothetical protein IPO39_13740 [Bacteroidetes bacterium]|nr:hypothetical protein [Bacteroidota bacterium]